MIVNNCQGYEENPRGVGEYCRYCGKHKNEHSDEQILNLIRSRRRRREEQNGQGY